MNSGSVMAKFLPGLAICIVLAVAAVSFMERDTRRCKLCAETCACNYVESTKP